MFCLSKFIHHSEEKCACKVSYKKTVEQPFPSYFFLNQNLEDFLDKLNKISHFHVSECVY